MRRNETRYGGSAVDGASGDKGCGIWRRKRDGEDLFFEEKLCAKCLCVVLVDKLEKIETVGEGEFVEDAGKDQCCCLLPLETKENRKEGVKSRFKDVDLILCWILVDGNRSKVDGFRASDERQDVEFDDQFDDLGGEGMDQKKG